MGQRGLVIWLTGLSGSGKSTIAYALEKRIIGLGKTAFVLDGDILRNGLCSELGFSPEDREENLKRASYVAAIMADAGIIVISSFISPYQRMRDKAKEIIGEDRFVEIHVHASLEECEERDPKGLYKKARNGEIQQFTGISAPYEIPKAPDLCLQTERIGAFTCVEATWGFVSSRTNL
jgi:adenylyl-sulfate kinase